MTAAHDDLPGGPRARELAGLALALGVVGAGDLARAAHHGELWRAGAVVSGAAAVCLLLLLAPWERFASRAPLAQALLLTAAAAGLRDAGHPPTVWAVMLLAVVWVALHGARRDLARVLAATCGTMLLEVLVAGAADRTDEWCRALAWAALASVVGIVLHGRVREAAARSAAHAALGDLLRTAAQGELVARMPATARAASGADAVVYVVLDRRGEPARVAGSDGPCVLAAAAATDVARERLARLLPYGRRAGILAGDLGVRGRAVVLLEPVVVDGAVHGVLVVAWRRRVAEGGPERRAVGLVAADAALLAARADLLARLTSLTRTDALTGILNRRAWGEELRREVARARRDSRPLSLVVLDLDHFKAYNDANGHRAGDDLLAEVASVWRASLRAVDVLARYGGEEFAAALPDCDAEEAVRLVDRLRAVLPGGVTTSAGIAVWNRAETPDDLFDRADTALYVAKAQGRDRAVVAPAVAPSAAAAAALAQRAREARAALPVDLAS